MAEIKLLAAIGRQQLLEALRLSEEQPFVVFGTLDGQVMSRIDTSGVFGTGPDIKVYLYETG